MGTGKADIKTIDRQLNGYQIGKLNQHPTLPYSKEYEHDDFITRYKDVLSFWSRQPKAACEAIVRFKNWTANDAVVGTTQIWLSENAWLGLESKLIAKENEAEAALLASQPPVQNTFSEDSRHASDLGSMLDDAFSGRNERGPESDTDSMSQFEFESSYHSASQMERQADLEQGITKVSNIPPEPVKLATPLRKRWLCCVWGSTFCCLPPCLSICGGMRRRDRQIAWREKVALCIIILVMNMAILFFIVGLGLFVCPKTTAKSQGTISQLNVYGSKAAVVMWGQYFYIKDVIDNHIASQHMADKQNSFKYWEGAVLGQDVSGMFPRDSSAAEWNRYCAIPQPVFRLQPELISGWYPHSNALLPQLKKNLIGDVLWSPSLIAEKIASVERRHYLTMYDSVYDVTAFYSDDPTSNGNFFLGNYFRNVSDVYSTSANFDSTRLFESLRTQDLAQFNRVMGCLNGLFKVGKVDHSGDLKCVLTNSILLAASAILVCVIGFKFFAALQFPGSKAPEEHDRFVICQVPCYTEVNATNSGRRIHTTHDRVAVKNSIRRQAQVIIRDM